MSKLGSKAIWITWESQVRNYSMADNLGIKLFEFIYSGNRIIRYAICPSKTFITLLKERPKVVFCSNPSIFLTIFLLLFKFLFHYKFIIDAHFIGVEAYMKGNIFQKILDYCNRRADMVIVTNEAHANYINKIGGKSFICEDPLPRLPIEIVKINKGMEKSVFFICSFNIDEPYKEVFEAAKYLINDGFKLHVSGNYRKAKLNPNEYPYVNILGYMPYSIYYTYLVSSDIILVLTSCENCLVCGAYEAMAAEKPLVTSDTEALRNYFTHGTIFTIHKAKNIADAVRFAYDNKDELIAGIKKWKIITYERQNKKMAMLKKNI